MGYTETAVKMILEEGVEESTMMKTPCLRYKSQFMAMMFAAENALIIKASPERVTELISLGKGRPFDFTGKRFKDWVLIPLEYERDYEGLLYEALTYVKNKL